MDLKLAGKNVIVTGGSRGIGFAIAKAFAEEGANVSICARSTDSLTAAETALKEYGTNVHSTICDVSDPVALDDFVHAAHETLGGLNVLVNNPSGFGKTDDEAGYEATKRILNLKIRKEKALNIQVVDYESYKDIGEMLEKDELDNLNCLLYTSPSPRDRG